MTSIRGRRGRDPEQHLIHENRTAADAFKGMFGEITGVAEGAGEGANIAELRFHNGVTYGGFAIPLAPALPPVPSSIPVARAVEPVEVTTTGANEAVAINHDLGYLPIVQVIDDSDNSVVDAKVQHHDEQNVTVTIPLAGDYVIVLR